MAGCHTPSTTSARGDWAVTSPSSRGLGAPGVCAFARLRCPAQVRPSGGPAPASSWAGPHPPRRRRTPWVLGPAEYRGWVLRPLQNSRNSPSSIHSPPSLCLGPRVGGSPESRWLRMCAPAPRVTSGTRPRVLACPLAHAGCQARVPWMGRPGTETPELQGPQAGTPTFRESRANTVVSIF